MNMIDGKTHIRLELTHSHAHKLSNELKDFKGVTSISVMAWSLWKQKYCDALKFDRDNNTPSVEDCLTDSQRHDEKSFFRLIGFAKISKVLFAGRHLKLVAASVAFLCILVISALAFIPIKTDREVAIESVATIFAAAERRILPSVTREYVMLGIPGESVDLFFRSKMAEIQKDIEGQVLSFVGSADRKEFAVNNLEDVIFKKIKVMLTQFGVVLVAETDPLDIPAEKRERFTAMKRMAQISATLRSFDGAVKRLEADIENSPEVQILKGAGLIPNRSPAAMRCFNQCEQAMTRQFKECQFYNSSDVGKEERCKRDAQRAEHVCRSAC